MPGFAIAGGGGGSPAAPAMSAYGGGGGWGIGGGLNFGGMGAAAGMDFSGNPAALSASYASAYNAALGLNSQNYNNILAGYQQTAGNLNNATNQVAAGYGKLQTDVLNNLSLAGSTERQNINDRYAQEQGSALQSLVNRGLGNTTVQSAVQRGLIYDREKSNVNLAEQIANLKAGYQSNLGLAGLQYQGNAALQNTAQANQQLQWMNSVQAPYPDAGAYAKLAEMYGAAQQAEQNRQLQRDLASQMSGAARGGGGGGYSGYMGSPFGPSLGPVNSYIGPQQTGSIGGAGFSTYGGGYFDTGSYGSYEGLGGAGLNSIYSGASGGGLGWEGVQSTLGGASMGGYGGDEWTPFMDEWAY